MYSNNIRILITTSKIWNKSDWCTHSDISDYRFHRDKVWISLSEQISWTCRLPITTKYMEASWIKILITCDCERYIIYAWVYIWESNYNILPIQNISFIWFEHQQHCNDPLTFVGNCLYCKGLGLKEDIGRREEEVVEKTSDRRSTAEECFEAYQISLTYANTPGR